MSHEDEGKDTGIATAQELRALIADFLEGEGMTIFRREGIWLHSGNEDKHSTEGEAIRAALTQVSALKAEYERIYLEWMLNK